MRQCGQGIGWGEMLKQIKSDDVTDTARIERQGSHVSNAVRNFGSEIHMDIAFPSVVTGAEVEVQDQFCVTVIWTMMLTALVLLKAPMGAIRSKSVDVPFVGPLKRPHSCQLKFASVVA